MTAKKFKVGDRVRIRYDLSVGNIDGLFFNPGMNDFRGKEFMIVSRYSDVPGVEDSYCLEGVERWSFNDEMLEAVEPTTSGYIKFEKIGTFAWAVEQMKLGKKVKQKSFINPKLYLAIPDGSSMILFYRNYEPNSLNNQGIETTHIEATDWEIYKEKFAIKKDCFYNTINGKFLYIHEITRTLNSQKIVSIITGSETNFLGDSKTVVCRQVFNEEDFLKLVNRII